jgi:RNA polymerase sigma factor (sigma-70 family)
MADAKRATVYVIDDDGALRRSLRRLLRLSGYEVEEFASAEEFLQRPTAEGPACVVLDVRMPRMTGTELFDRMAQRGDSPPVVFLTGHGDVPTSVHAMKGGAIDFLVKPVDAKSLLRAIEDAISFRAARLAREKAAAELRARLERLSPREREVMEHVVRGEPNKLIGAKLGISEKTVKVHRQRVMAKMEATSLAELVRLAGAVPPRTPRGRAPSRPRAR